ncbi:MAG: DNA mismatch repair protein MutS, partial [Bacilli bacterium]|nr:DNA mismatch repair protein MutS [Bacilli bacterium]
YHSVSSYLDKLTEKGYKVAIVEQTEDPALAKGLVNREVVRIITPGTVMEGNTLDEKDNNYLVCLSQDKDRYLLSYCDLSTGENFLTNLPLNDDILISEILKLKSKEVVIGDDFNINILSPLERLTPITFSIENNTNPPSYLKGLAENLDKMEEKNFFRLLNYILRTQKRTLIHMQKVIKYDSDGFLKIDLASRRNLELIETLRFQNKKNTLFNILDKCMTAMGSRFLKKQLIFPLIDQEKLEKRYDVIDKMKKKFLDTADLRKALEPVYDLERIVGKIAYESVNPRDFLQLKKSLSMVPKIRSAVEKIKIQDYFDFSIDYESVLKLQNLIELSISEDAPFSPKEGNVIKDGFSEDLDHLRTINSESKDYLLDLELKEREKTGIRNLKVGYNRVFGYYIEVSKGSKELVKDEFGYIRKQTLANSERYITQELKEKEASILRAEEKTLSLEYQLFTSVREEAKTYTHELQELAKKISELDMMVSLYTVANENKYVRPIITNDKSLELKASRHPVLEKYTDNFIPNDLSMNPEDTIVLVTGPNMSGKSTYMRQIALIAIMAQIGSFVSAQSAKLPIFDSIYTRIGAADDIVSGQSTFMVEMTEVNNALANATKNSLILFDEIGRGTATYDGMALAQAIIEYIHEKIKCKTLFSTHYHELTSLEDHLKNLKNVHVSAEEVHGEIVFMHKVLRGSVDKSYGINVARLASIPLEVTLRAEDLLHKLETNKIEDKSIFSLQNYQAPMLFDSKTEKETLVLNKIKTLELYKMSPLEALNTLDELQKLVKK